MSLLKDKIEVELEEVEIAAQKSLSGVPRVFKWFLISTLVAVIPAYFIAKSVTTGIWLKKYNQTQITAHPSFANPKPVITSDITVTSGQPGSYAAVLQITNPNLDLSLEKVPYQVNFYNAQKQQIYSYPDTLYLLPNQTKYLTVPTFTASDQIVYSNIQLPNILPWQKRLQIPAVSITLSQPSSSQQSSPPAFAVSGNFTNQSPYSLSQVRLVFVLYDLNNNIIGVSQRDEFTVAPFEDRSYLQLWPNQYPENLGKIDVEAYTDTMDPDNLSVPPAPSGAASDLSRPTNLQSSNPN